jgi:RNA polymerase sigma-70 factor (ECF subfamily)
MSLAICGSARARLAAPAREIDDLTLARAQRGDEAACRQLFRHHRDAVFSLIWRMLGRRASRAAADDLTQEAFLRVFRALPTFAPSGPARLSTWILTITMRVVLNELRARRVDAIALASPAGDANAITAPDSSERRRIGAAIILALDALPPDHRAVFLLREYHELSYDEIAGALAIELGTVKSRLGRARAALRSALEGVRDAR